MMGEKLYKYHNICGKDVYVVEDHHHVLLPWALQRRKLEFAPNLITLDHHTDTLEAFMRYRYAATSQGFNAQDTTRDDAMLSELIKELNWRDDDAVTDSIELLRNDEHISAALYAGILDWAFSFNLSMYTTSSIEEDNWRKNDIYNRIHSIPSPERPYTYKRPPDNIFKISATCAVDCEGPHEDDCVPYHYSQVVESSYLERNLSRAQEMYAGFARRPLLSEPYILDIDLDYFHSEQSIQPRDPATLHRLIQGAVGITLATEPDFVEGGRIKGSSIDSEYLLGAMLNHIENALAGRPDSQEPRGRRS
ncbi:UPF0489 family protein [Janthinobacterium sp. GMG2]|uniref:UPF0489 family protein n=1 Tax=Janthinobacterium sp. GMG2 TaxID=3096606 RepID=UPI0029F56975|nr:UPF0489 family protein [Janthinobacterium sp. GMG2]MDX8123096.1 UPF0489 family protein [Janthinobacterium sp. GMG2]